MSLDKVKNRINALLAKNTENVASEEEMLSAIKLAEKLMRKYSILKSELPERNSKEKCVLVSHPKYKTGYKTEFFLGELAHLFDCEHYFTKSNVTFFGYKEDVKLCIYFYDLILALCFKEKEKFFNSSKGKELKAENGKHGKTLAANFIKGFLLKIDERLYKMYEEKKAESNQNERAIILSKKGNVESQFKELDINIKVSSTTQVISDFISYTAGKEKAESVPLNHPLYHNESKESSIHKLNNYGFK